jgi:antitoxin ChpS
MTRLKIQKSGGDNIISIPNAVLKVLGLHTNSTVDLSLENQKIVLTPTKETFVLEDILAGSPKKNLELREEDTEWLND